MGGEGGGGVDVVGGVALCNGGVWRAPVDVREGRARFNGGGGQPPFRRHPGECARADGSGTHGATGAPGRHRPAPATCRRSSAAQRLVWMCWLKRQAAVSA